jgi:hypothetical protein
VKQERALPASSPDQSQAGGRRETYRSQEVICPGPHHACACQSYWLETMTTAFGAMRSLARAKGATKAEVDAALAPRRHRAVPSAARPA